MPLEYLDTLLKDGLFFKFSNLYDDENEGYISKKYFDEFNSDIEKMCDYLGFEKNDEVINNTRDIIKDISISRRGNTLINCWHENNEFSKEMWVLYAKKGVYIKTNSLFLTHSIPENMIGLLKNSGSSILHKIDYISSHKKIKPSKAKKIIKSGNEHSLKGDEYSIEAEYRLIIDVAKVNAQTDFRIKDEDQQLKIKGNEKWLIKITNNDIKKYRNENNELEGIYFRIKPLRLIEEIGTVGEAKCEEIKNILEKRKITLPIRVYTEDFNQQFPLACK